LGWFWTFCIFDLLDFLRRGKYLVKFWLFLSPHSEAFPSFFQKKLFTVFYTNWSIVKLFFKLLKIIFHAIFSKNSQMTLAHSGWKYGKNLFWNNLIYHYGTNFWNFDQFVCYFFSLFLIKIDYRSRFHYGSISKNNDQNWETFIWSVSIMDYFQSPT
jgi:hypothetical protein